MRNWSTDSVVLNMQRQLSDAGLTNPANSSGVILMGWEERSGSVAYVGLEDSVEPSSSLSGPDRAESLLDTGVSGMCSLLGGENTRDSSTVNTWSSV